MFFSNGEPCSEGREPPLLGGPWARPSPETSAHSLLGCALSFVIVRLVLTSIAPSHSCFSLLLPLCSLLFLLLVLFSPFSPFSLFICTSSLLSVTLRSVLGQLFACIRGAGESSSQGDWPGRTHDGAQAQLSSVPTLDHLLHCAWLLLAILSWRALLPFSSSSAPLHHFAQGLQTTSDI